MQYSIFSMRFVPSELARLYWQPQQLRLVAKPPWNAPFDTTTLLSSTSSSAALTGGLLAPDPSFHNTPDWDLFPHSDSQYLGDGTQLLPGVPTSLSIAEDNMNMLAMPPGMGNINTMNTSAPMTRGNEYATLLILQHLTYVDYSQSGSSSTSHKDQSSSSPEQISSSKLSSTKNSPKDPEPSCRVEKRKANTLAARRYRQKRVDQMSTLETELKEVKAERDDLKVRNARLEGEVETLRALLRSQK
ncbi:hypothetical protein BKA58DRAFT_401457 [Alternaria rosae]|uniref:uncharacterized protein n=1 Tax=Alternaria rosae TaxID=1187941 RepID=UPI001E8D78EA|nr:uncharacterized protein BKA58DRAFT_401457 [Alternaria rosae]KAH6873346.1 hypothetical protein BKA58DRAFT_401457 [Alternaria rosae]